MKHLQRRRQRAERQVERIRLKQVSSRTHGHCESDSDRRVRHLAAIVPFREHSRVGKEQSAMAKNDPFFDLTVQSTSGSFTDRWNKNNRAEKVYEEALKRLNLPAGPYLLKRARDGVVLTLSEKLEDVGLVDGDVLILQAAQPQDG
ncbi:MAG: hypothetical protein ABIX10_08085 [Acidimicrobiales bacterium]